MLSQVSYLHSVRTYMSNTEKKKKCLEVGVSEKITANLRDEMDGNDLWRDFTLI